MKTHPILFSGPMIRALLDGRKTQTRRVLKPQPDTARISKPFHPEPRGGHAWVFMARDDFPGYSYATADFRALHALGDLLWVRETAWICPPGWTTAPVNPKGPLGQETAYRADDTSGGTAEAARDYGLKLTPSIHMPRWASRLTLRVTDVRVQRVQDISEEGARAEGIEEEEYCCGIPGGETGGSIPIGGCCGQPLVRPVRDVFANLWNTIHGPDAWDRNDWVTATTFQVIQRNVDDVLREEAA